MSHGHFISGLGSELFFLSIINEIPVPSLILRGKDFLVELANEEALRLLGRTAEITGKPLLAVLPELKNQLFYQMLSEAVASRKIKEGREVHTIIDKNGTLSSYFINFIFKPLSDDTGAVTGVICLGYDVTEQKLAEEKLARLAAIVESSNDAIISTRLDGVITSWNKTAEIIYGYTQGEMIGEKITRIIPEDLVHEDLANTARLKSKERISHYETRRVRKDGTVIDVSLTISPIKDAHGHIIGISKMSRDITGQKIAERKLKENEERLQMVVQASDLGTWEFNLDTGELRHSANHAEIYGYPEGTEFTAQRLMMHLHPADKHIQDKAYSQALKTGKMNFEARIIRRDGGIRWIESNARIIYD